MEIGIIEIGENIQVNSMKGLIEWEKRTGQLFRSTIFVLHNGYVEHTMFVHCPRLKKGAFVIKNINTILGLI